MAAESMTMSADEVRKEGNELYKAGNFQEAIVLYNQAAELDPSRYEPHSNLASTYFELGEYDNVISACDAAMALLSNEDKYNSARQKISVRKAKACIYSKLFDAAQHTLDDTPPSQETRVLNRCIHRHRENVSLMGDGKATHTKLILELPRYKPAIRNTGEFYTVGHDTPESLAPDSKTLSQINRKKISLFFGGVGDARNLHMTMIMLGLNVHKDKLLDEKSFHFTINDLKAPAIARDLLVLLMLDEIANSKTPEEAFGNGLLHLLYYTYLAPIMPEMMYNLLQHQIRKAIASLEDRFDLPSYIDVPAVYRPKLLKILKEWQHEAPKQYTCQRLRKETVRLMNRKSMERQMMYGLPGDSKTLGVCKKQRAFYVENGILMMSEMNNRLIDMEIPEICKAYDEFDENNPHSLDEKILSRVDETWGPNVTMVDLEWLRNREDWSMDIDVSNDPFEFASKLQDVGLAEDGRQSGLFDFVAFWFSTVAKSLKKISHRIKIEACIGDVSAVLEQIRYGIVGHRQVQDGTLKLKPTAEECKPTAESCSTGEAAQTPLAEQDNNSGPDLSDRDQDMVGPQNQAPKYPELEEYPQMYDRIHLSNSPDYISGTLTSFMYALPITWPGKSSYITSTCLRNSPIWQSLAHFNNEYTCLSAPSDLAKIFHVRAASLDNPDLPFFMREYVEWHHSPRSKDSAGLMPRPKLETWLYRIFLKLAIPVKRPMRHMTLIYSPLNLTAFIRICTHLHTIGYPAHWMVTVIEAIVSGKITAKARPPRSDPLKIREVKTEMPALQQSTRPFVAEMSTLLAMAQVAMPFGMHVPDLPKVNAIHKYNLILDEIPDDPVAETPSFILVFFAVSNLPPGTKDLRPYLLSDETADLSSSAKDIRDNGLHLVTTWIWERATRLATFWLRQDVMESMKNNGWAVAIWRADNWCYQMLPLDIKDVQDTGINWSSK